MSDSLIVAGFELLGGSTAYRLMKGTFDLGYGVPDTTTIASLLLDGDPVTGDRTGNRQVNLTVYVLGSSRTDISAKVDALALAVNVHSGSTFTVQWTPNGGLPIIFDCFRATVVPQRSITRDNQLVGVVTLSCAAMPFGRSPIQQTVTVSTKSQVDSFDTAPTGATLDTTTKVEGTGSAKVTGNQVGSTSTYTPSVPVSRSFAARDYSTYANFVMQAAAPHLGTLTSTLSLTLTLSSASGSTTYPVVTEPFTNGAGDAGFHAINFPLTGGTATAGSGVTLTAVTSYSLATSLVAPSGTGQPASLTWNLDDLEATGTSAAGTSTTRGELLLVTGIIGSARTPVSIAATGTIQSLLIHRPPADQNANLQILTGVTVGGAPSTPAASTVAAVNAHYDGTFTAMLGVSATGAAVSNTVSVVVTQLENGVAVATATLTATYTSPLSDFLVKLKDSLGNDLTLPLRAVPSDNTLTTYTFAFNHSAGSDAYSDFMLLDTRGQRVIADPPGAVAAIYLDEPPPTKTFGGLYASASDRSMAYGILDMADIAGGPMIFEPGNNRVLLWSDAAKPASATFTDYPRWQHERVT